MQTEAASFMATLSRCLTRLSCHLRGHRDDWEVKVVKTKQSKMLTCFKEDRAFLEVEILCNGTVNIRPLSPGLKAPKTARLKSENRPQASIHLQKPCKATIVKRRRAISQHAKDTEDLLELPTPSHEGEFNMPKEMMFRLWERGTKSRL